MGTPNTHLSEFPPEKKPKDALIQSNTLSYDAFESHKNGSSLSQLPYYASY